ncbi:MAG TPA: carboxypeptidase-like regulatory domain-containing protein, partial [Acidobacteriaceae bacterium]|nr:carboxypeptidase-like regulatory domain-containing protein [Acidobacteriaceae bacterium]
MKSLSKLFPRRKLQWGSSFLLLLAVFALSAPTLLAQGYGAVSGTVTDPTGASIPNATVTATQTDTGRETTVTSNQTGGFVFTTLPPASYNFKVSAAGFQTYQQNAVLQANQSLTLNPKLTIGGTTQTVEVSTAPPQIDTTTGTVSEVIDRQRVVDLPLNGRNAASLMLLVAGVGDATKEGNGVDQGNGKTFPAAVVITSNGTLPNQSNYLLDGGNNVDELTNVNAPFPMPDALQEFSIQTSNYDAQFGQSAGAVVNIVTRAGTAAFHGDVFEFLRNGYFNARPYFATRADNLHRHQFGGTIGGPVIIPGLSTGKTTQFFFGYQHTIANQISTASSTVPTLAEEGRTATGLAAYADLGNFCKTGFDASGICTTATQQVRNPFTNALYPFNRIPSSAFDPAAVSYQSHFPTASADAGPGIIGNTVNYSRPVLQSFDEYTARVDHDFGSHDHLFGRYFYDWYTQKGVFNPNNLLSYASYFNTRYQNALLSETHTFTPNILNSLVLNYQRMVALRGGPPGSTNITDYGVTNIWQPATGPFLQATISGYFGASSSAYAAWGRNNYTFNDDLHWVKGNHNFAFGGHFELSKVDVTNVYTSYGSFSFNSVTSKIGSNTYYYPNAYGNFLMGFMSGFGQGNYELVNDRNHFPGVYGQDSWKATRRLQLNYGVRWESFAPWHDRRNVMTEFEPSAYTANQHSQVYSNLPAGLLV